MVFSMNQFNTIINIVLYIFTTTILEVPEIHYKDNLTYENKSIIFLNCFSAKTVLKIEIQITSRLDYQRL